MATFTDAEEKEFERVWEENEGDWRYKCPYCPKKKKGCVYDKCPNELTCPP